MGVRPIEKYLAREKLRLHLTQHGKLAEIFGPLYILFAGCPNCHNYLEYYRRLAITK